VEYFITCATTFGAMFVFIFLKAFQQRNVSGDARWFYVVATSMALAATEVYVISVIVATGYQLALILSIGLGSGFGCVTAMATHRFLFRDKGRRQ
jgi:hypothetical protein